MQENVCCRRDYLCLNFKSHLRESQDEKKNIFTNSMRQYLEADRMITEIHCSDHYKVTNFGGFATLKTHELIQKGVIWPNFFLSK